MKYAGEFRDPALAKAMLATIEKQVADYPGVITLMEVCGTHTMSIYQHGIRNLLPKQIRLISGPGCPVCVTPIEYVDKAVAYARQADVVIATFGDMVRVPGSSSSLLREQASGAQIKIVYSPLDAVALAEKNPEKIVIFLGVGFETTAPTIAGSIVEAKKRGLKNYFVLCAHKTMPTPMAALTSDPELQVDGYICPAHVSAVIGAEAYKPLAEQFKVPCVVTGFEPLDMLRGVQMLVQQVLDGRAEVENEYQRIVKPQGNAKAQALLADVFELCDTGWRGIGMIPGSGLRIRDEFAEFDAEKQIPVEVEEPKEHEGCLCGEILKGKVTPKDCPLFRTACTPENPVGACMVSSEGTCAAEYKYGTD
ncbi:Hydrogenase maturation protein HypD [Malonomonas rubra DSM 5091]|uniref:Hydrogenase maturation protein HypD n=1 Tax=Malonomonas rubra DSM 5091 TaxID=1122189 RepID=A0A1M6GEC7_MALRU|nr:hydrogenase formation protein HypD [Malonomonas rubra]SHJ08274.1 Hydrogenase maturation protein HypD [Malonomonas rubra DSM 5091]